MLKTRKRWISLLVMLAMLVTFVVPFAGPASAGAASYNTVTQVPKFDPSTAGTITSATVQVKVDPAVSDILSKAWIEVLDANGKQLNIRSVVYSSSSGIGQYTLTALDSKKAELTFTPDGSKDKATFNFTVDFYGKDCAAGDVSLNFFNTSGQLEGGKVVVARALGGQVELALVGSAPTFGVDTYGTVTIRLTQAVSGSLKRGTESVKIKLPAGFKWSNPSPGSGAVTASVTTDEPRLLKVNVSTDTTTYPSIPSVVDISARVQVDDEDVAKTGDVVATIEGGNDTTVTPSEITVAKYAEYGVKVSVASVKTLLSGILDEKTDKITIEELVEDSLINGRKVTVELPDWVKIRDCIDRSSDLTSYATSLTWSDNKLTFYPSGDKGDTRKYEFKLKLSIEAGRAGDIEAAVSGAGAPETKVVVAKAAPAVSGTATPTDVKIGVQAQAAPDLVITEAAGGAIKQGTNRSIAIILPSGVTFAATPTVEVVSGDLELKADQARVTDAVYTSDNTVTYGSNRVFEVPVKSESLRASTIKISGIKLTLDRTVPEGDLKVKIGGLAVVENYGTGDNEFRTDAAAEVVLAKCVTPAPGETKGVAVFKIGEKKYTVNGQEFEMDVAPIAEAGRTYLPARFVANAMGVPDANILWDQASKTVTVIRGERFVQMKVGSKQILVNGITLNMDVAPKVVPGRVLIPFRFLAQALGAEVVWDPADPNTIILNF
ncbi:copper amine oxidase-like protein [Thermacetogenium phaeum DSM 12270]|uniref:Copper amine oxidase-like protein n=1 Tax=Thermacetogenium phaeum (strain ATCC BAA-254 / DSM 26808 / PB) TaxID=1089553 RepID=K4LQS0_THEPS|nr:copper amine oxidase N-terminal domain-containing protein [Thermacetogenium phaeum]AFV10449.1 copper amine oxidase-like protein [Thermacetogenium phaeum DSM 12270]